jgi:hypothetical protein
MILKQSKVIAFRDANIISPNQANSPRLLNPLKQSVKEGGGWKILHD